jgi:hypothetical protein
MGLSENGDQDLKSSMNGGLSILNEEIGRTSGFVEE